MFFTKSELAKIRDTRFAIAGLGGVGAIVAELVARWGVKRVRLLDKDRYEVSNLNRQIFATTYTLGDYKTDVAKKRIKEISPCTEVEMVINKRCDAESVFNFLNGADIVIQTTDSPSSILFYKIARSFKIPLVNGYSTVTGGCVSVYDYRNSDCYSIWEQIKDKLKWRGIKDVLEMNSEELDLLDKMWGHGTTPTINFVTNTVGCIIVSEAIKLITNKGKSVKYPYKIEFDLFSPSLRKKKMCSLFCLSNYKKLIQILKNKMR